MGDNGKQGGSSLKFISTRGKAPEKTLSQSIHEGLAQDGGLYVPEKLPSFNKSSFKKNASLEQIGNILLDPFFKEDALAPYLSKIIHQALNFPLPLSFVSEDTAYLELFHGPTSAFKDVGARFLSECFSFSSQSQKRTILVATSGDTGGAVASAFEGKKNIQVIILFPEEGVSARQKHQLTCWGANVRSFSVRGSFDDCQKLVKEAFRDEEFKNTFHPSSANSINIGRLLPQTLYYAYSSLAYETQTGSAPGFIVPTGNLGNALGCFWAKSMGFPIREIVMVSNQNTVIPDYYKSGNWEPRSSQSTLANAMDVGNPSNAERLFHLFPNLEDLKKVSSAYAVDDDLIKKTILKAYQEWGMIVCPHTATAVAIRDKLPSQHWIMTATAHPAKFPQVIEPIINETLDLPPALNDILQREGHYESISPSLESLKERL